MGKNNQLSRRKFLALSSGTLLQIGLPGTFITLSQAENLALASELRPDGRVRLPPGQQAVQAIQVMGGDASNIPMEEALKGNVILSQTYSKEPLPTPHGAPLRALVPDRYFYKSAKWIEWIKFSEQDEMEYWESNGYSNSADPWKEERFQ